jgi:hypothetical protein
MMAMHWLAVVQYIALRDVRLGWSDSCCFLAGSMTDLQSAAFGPKN